MIGDGSAETARANLLRDFDELSSTEQRLLLELDSDAFEVADDGCFWADGWDKERLLDAWPDRGDVSPVDPYPILRGLLGNGGER